MQTQSPQISQMSADWEKTSLHHGGTETRRTANIGKNKPPNHKEHPFDPQGALRAG
jgi:hypothetical protein